MHRPHHLASALPLFPGIAPVPPFLLFGGFIYISLNSADPTPSTVQINDIDISDVTEVGDTFTAAERIPQAFGFDKTLDRGERLMW